MNIQERINNLGDYFKGMQVSAENGIIYVTVQFHKGWACSEVTEHNFNVKAVQDDTPGLFYFFTDMEVGFDKVFDAIDYNIRFNEEAQAKVNLLRNKIEALRSIFENEDIDKLKRLEFTFKKPETKKKAKKVKEPELVSQVSVDEKCSTIEAYNYIPDETRLDNFTETQEVIS